MKRFVGIVAVGLLTAIPAARSQSKTADLKEVLAGTTERGRALYHYDQCAWHGTDAIFALHPDFHGGARYICVKSAAGWRLVFPRWNASHDHLLIAYEATGSGEVYHARKVDPPQDAGDALLGDERALELAFSDFGPPGRPYNSAVLSAPDGNLFVYLYPGQTKDTVWPLGGDVRYTISADGTRIVEKRQLHKGVLDMNFDPAKQAISGFHSHVLSDVPEDTDVLYVLNRRPRMPETIGTPGGWAFSIEIDGTIGTIPPCAKGNPLPCKDHKPAVAPAATP